MPRPSTFPSIPSASTALVAAVVGAAGVLGLSTSGTADASSTGLPSALLAPCVWKTSDIIDPSIDVSAQQSLMRAMSKGSPVAKKNASAIIGAVKSGELAGVYLPPRKAVSDRGKLLSPPKGYWQLIPTGQPSTCLTQPGNLAPMIIYREGLSESQIDAAIASAWTQCGLQTPATCGYNVDVTKPECMTHLDCIVENLGNVCIEHECETQIVPNGTKPAQEKTPTPKVTPCWYQINCEAHQVCVGADPSAYPVVTGVCKDPAGGKACHDAAWKQLKADVHACGVAQTPDVVECLADANQPVSLAVCIGRNAFVTDNCVKKADTKWRAALNACDAARKGRSSTGRRPNKR